MLLHQENWNKKCNSCDVVNNKRKPSAKKETFFGKELNKKG